MSQGGPAVDLARGDRVAGYRVTSVLGYGREGVATTVTDEFLNIDRVLKAYPAEPYWIERLCYVATAFFALADLGVCPRPLHGGVTVSSPSVPLAYLVFERRLGKSLEVMLRERRWTVGRARQLASDLAEAIAATHAIGWSLGDFEHGNNVVLVQGRPLFVDIGFNDDDEPKPDYGEDFECLASIVRTLGQRARDDALQVMADSLDHRRERRLDRRSFAVWLKRHPIEI